MSPWFNNKVMHVGIVICQNCDVSSEPIDSFKFLEWKEKARSAFFKVYPSRDFSEGHTPVYLNSESTATKEWIISALRSNTGQDRICAMAYLINTHPTYCLRYLDSLISIINPAKQRDCFQSIDALYQLWDKSLLPKNRCLIPISCRPFDIVLSQEPDEAEKTLSLWFFEDELKSRYLRFIKALERLLMTDTIESFKRKSIGVLSNLLCRSPENQSVVLAAVVNKLGDRSKVLASCVIHKLRLIERAKYYAVSMLSCLQLRSVKQKGTTQCRTGNTAIKLVKLYTAFFHTTVKSEEVPERLVMALLTGLSRAAPFVPVIYFSLSPPDDRLTEYLKEVDDIFRLVHTTSFNVSLQALTVLLQLSSHRPEIRDRYYQALYRKLRDPDLLQTSRGPSVLHLIYRSMLDDPDADRRAAFTQRLLQLCLVHPQPGFVVGSLILLSKVHVAKQNLIISSQLPVKIQDAPVTPLINNDRSVVSMNTVGSTDKNDDDDEEEHFSDAPDSDEEANGIENDSSPEQPISKIISTWEHRRNANLRRTGSKSTGISGVQKAIQTTTYNPEAREPLFARAGGYPTWPLVLLCNHTHPSVSLLARTLLTGDVIAYTGNPFDDFSIQHFLDRFAYKKPKSAQLKASKNEANKQNAPPGRPFQRQVGVKTGSRALPVNSALFRQMAENHVPADEQFFHKYFKFLEARYDQKIKKSLTAEESDASSVSDDEFDAYLHKYERGLIASGPDIDEDDDIKFDNADFSDHSGEPDEEPGSADEEMFSDGRDGDDDSDSDDEIASRKSKSRRLNSVFASADEVGQLYRVQETPRERRQRLWEEKRSDISSHHRGGQRGRGRNRSRRHGDGDSKPLRQNTFAKTKRGQFRSQRGGKRDSRRR
ncbi:Ribosome biogenesis protein MAK21 [Fasciola gigantica]|uniref:Ribosome biogenesis protein MAK21 n=1 Tax=Fasciola gigantica TaxID=46835 RepID=A0A504YJJ2_FASGI|nr:Ribosome biogenesis protein MAK21 [Fasciola gigantica]